jgi:hypothetical protein
LRRLSVGRPVMIKALVDPLLFVPPSDGTFQDWVHSLRLWSERLRTVDGKAVTPVMSLNGQAVVASAGSLAAIRSALEAAGSPLGAGDIISLIANIRGRVATPDEAFEPNEVIFSQLGVDPEYVGSGSEELVEAFRQDLGQGATCQQETDLRVAVITSSGSWASTEANRAMVKAVVEAWEKFGDFEEPDEASATVSEAMDLWTTPRAADATLTNCWTGLIDFPKLAIEVAYRAFTPESEEKKHPLRFQVGSQLTNSMKALGYSGKRGRIKATFHAAAYVACQRAGDLQSLESHPYRKSEKGAAPPIERSDGAKLMRGKLGTGPSASRLMWWDGPEPEILGVVGHNEDPGFLTN